MLVALGVSLAAKAQDGPAPKLAWQIGPTTGAIGDKATIAVPAGYGFLGAADTKKFLELNHNLASGREYLLAPAKFNWFALFEFEPVGYVKDNEAIDTDEVLRDVREGTARGNEERRKRGWDTMTGNICNQNAQTFFVHFYKIIKISRHRCHGYIMGG